MEIILIPNSPQFWNHCWTCFCSFSWVCVKECPVGWKKASYVLPVWHNSNNRGIKEPCSGRKKVHDRNKKPNILLFHVGMWFSLKFWRKLRCRFCPPFSFFRGGSWMISRLAGGSPEVSAFLLTWTGIGLKNPLKVIVALKSHTSQMAPPILHQLLRVVSSLTRLCSPWRKKHYLS